MRVLEPAFRRAFSKARPCFRSPHLPTQFPPHRRDESAFKKAQILFGAGSRTRFPSRLLEGAAVFPFITSSHAVPSAPARPKRFQESALQILFGVRVLACPPKPRRRREPAFRRAFSKARPCSRSSILPMQLPLHRCNQSAFKKAHSKAGREHRTPTTQPEH